MPKPIISAIAAIGARNRALGKGGDLIWKIPEDLQRFKRLTSGHPIIMGRKTYESIGRPLPNRTNIVVTRNPDYEADGCLVVHSLEEALARARQIENTEICIIGGSYIFTEALPQIDRLYLTLIDSDEKGDVYFPEYEQEFTRIISREDHQTKDGLKYSYVTLERE